MLFTSLSVLILYAWARFIPTGYRLPLGEAVSDLAAALSALIALVTGALCLWLPSRHRTTVALAVYILLATLVITLIMTSGTINSPFLVLILPLILGLLLLRRRPNGDLDAVSDLKHKLSTVEGKSDVVINTIDDGVLAISQEGTIELINPSAQRIIGWNQGDALGLKWQSVIKLIGADSRDIADIDNPVAQALTTNRPAHTDKLLLKTSSDKHLMISIVASPVGKHNEGIIVVFRDITKEKAEEREQAEFISTASHEMRTPVASIEGYLGLALNPATAQIDEKARDFITKAHESAQHLGRLFQDLLDVSRAEDGRLKSEPRLIDVVGFIGTIFEGLAPKADEKGLQYIYRPAASAELQNSERTIHPVFYAHVDPDHLREVTANLIENAIKYTPEGQVIVDVAGDDTVITISVKDSGIGIPAEDIPHLFQKFYRVDNSDTREIGGTGLGLYLSRRLAETMSGRLWVESEYQQGSTFFLEIPRTRSTDAPALQPAETLAAPDMVSTPEVAPQAPDIAPISTTTPVATPPRQPDLATMSLADIEQHVAAHATDTPAPSLESPQAITQPQPPQPTDRAATLTIPPRT